MITFDKIKLITKLQYLTIKNNDVFEKRENTKKGITTFIFNQRKPYSLFIHITPILNKVVIEFTGKILLDDYPKLISLKTIRKCLQNINNLGFWELKIEDILFDSELVKCDLTKDISLILKCNIKKVLISHQTNFNKFHLQKYLTGYTVTKDVKTNNCKIRLSIYDKNAEMLTADSKHFLNELSDSESLLMYFSNKYRIEVNLSTKEQIRNYLNISDNCLINALRSNENPLLKIFNLIFDSTIDVEDSNGKNRNLFEYESLSQLKDGLILKACDYDLSQIDKILNHYLSPETNKRKYRPRFRKLLNETTIANENRFIVGQIRDQLKAS